MNSLNSCLANGVHLGGVEIRRGRCHRRKAEAPPNGVIDPVFVRAGVSNADDSRRVVEDTIARLGRIDGLVSNAVCLRSLTTSLAITLNTEIRARPDNCADTGGESSTHPHHICT